jgi:2,4-dienoyl-CoA reductase-like NADH-dependent reductase (Old Yellow Enzyme family)
MVYTKGRRNDFTNPRPGVNKRADRYGGSVENRCRLLSEVTRAICEVMGSGRVGVWPGLGRCCHG